jgi:crotonobetainyl-CoA:carnitine CoA-transferase CaiB-like acyl-CoA transferase
MGSSDAVPGVLDGVEVLDLSWGIAGPIATMMLADNGARVTKIEPPQGDPFAGQSGYVVWQRGKARATMDLADPAHRDEFVDLVMRADVLVESFAPGTTDRLGIDYASLAEINPGLIYCSITGYGRRNRHSDRPGYDALVAARTGLLYDHRGRAGTVMEYINGRPGPHPEFGAPEGLVRGADRPGPVLPRSTWPSLGAAYLASLGISAALRARAVTGAGQWVETSLLQGALAAVSMAWQRVENPDAPLYWMWPADSRAIDGLFQCADGRWVHHWMLRPSWVKAAAAGESLRVPELEGAYRDDPDRIGMEPADLLVGAFLYPDLVEAFRRFPSDEWVRVGEQSGMGVSLVRTPAEALADPAYLADGCVVEVEHPEHGRIRHLGNVLEFSETPGGVRTQPRRRAMSRPPLVGGGSLGAPLDGVRVLDLGLGVAGPFGSRMLADLGADVIKVNALHDVYWNGTHMGLGTNRGKRSIALNLKDPRGMEVLHTLIDGADVVTTNWRPGAAARLGIDYESLRERHPRLIFCNSRGYEKGPRSALPGTEQTAYSLAGTEWEDGAADTGNPPVWSRSGFGDTGNGLLTAIAITQALYHRDRTGRGQEVGTSIVNACLLASSYSWIHADGTPGEWAKVDKDQYGLSAYYRLYEVSDGWVCVAAVTEEQRAKLHDVLGVPMDDPGDVAGLADELHRRSAIDAFKALDGAGVPVEIVNEAFCREIFDDPEARDLGWVATTTAGNVGRFEDAGLLINFSATPGVVQRGPCMSGEHTREILHELGYAGERIDELVAAGTVADGTVVARWR